jgi:hypothetical protein
MTHRRILIALALLCSAAAGAQMQDSAPPMAIPMTPEQRIEATPQPGQIELAQRPAINERRAQADADARHCLQATTNMDVHRCAAPFLRGGRGARAASGRTAKPAPRPGVGTAASGGAPAP